MFEVTDEPVTERVLETVLGWLDEYRANQWRLNGKKCVACPITSENLADLLSAGDLNAGGN